MAYTTIDDPSEFFQTALWTGNGGTQSITNDGNSDLQPDWVWIKERSSADDHKSYDSSRGATKKISQNDGSAEENQSGLTAFSSDGFSLGSHAGSNQGSTTYVAWQWKANGGTTTSVSGTGTAADSTKAGTFQANTTAGFSIVTFSTGSDDNGDHRIQHGLGAVPNFIITKERDGTYEWYTYHHKGTDDNDYLRLNLTDATSNASARNVFDGSDFTSTYFEMDNNNIIRDNKTYVAYCFTEIQGYSKFGSYTGNSAADGTFVYTGFKPAWVMTKAIFSQGDSNNYNFWTIVDNTRTPNNNISLNSALFANSSNAEGVRHSGTGSGIAHMDLLSNGFKLRGSSYETNQAGTYVYLAFAEHPFVSSKGVPVTAR